MHDTIEFEKLGIPSTTIVTRAFSRAAVFQFRGKGMAGHPYVEIPHPVSNLTLAKMRELTLEYIDETVSHLISDQRVGF